MPEAITAPAVSAPVIRAPRGRAAVVLTLIGVVIFIGGVTGLFVYALSGQ